MFTARFFALLLLSGLPSALVHGQTDPVIRPRRAQTPAASQASVQQAPSADATAEAKRLYKEGVKFGTAGLFREAANNFEQAVKLSPEYGDAYLSLGHAYYDMHLWEQAIENLERGLSFKPKDKDAVYLLDRARMMLERESGGREKKPLMATSARQPSGFPTSLRRTASSTKPSDDSSLTKLYRVGSGDILEVRLTDDVSTQPALLTVTPAGLLEHPDLSAPVRCAGLTVEEITALIEDDLRRRPSVKRSNVSVAVNEYVSHTIIVSGLVKDPGPKIIKREAIPLYVVAADAQPLPEAASVTVLRHEPNESYVIDSLKPSDMSMLIRPGDVITFQPAVEQFFYVDGEVKSPGEKSFRRGLSLTQAIIAAGGLTKHSKEVRLARDNGKGFLIMSRYKLKDINSGKFPDPMIQPGDRITITK